MLLGRNVKRPNNAPLDKEQRVNGNFPLAIALSG